MSTLAFDTHKAVKTLQAVLEGDSAAVRTEVAEAKTELKTGIITLREDVSKSLQGMSTSIQGVYRLMAVAILTITSTISGAAIAPIRPLAP